MSTPTPPPNPSQHLRVLVAAGGTAGHLAPALATADVLRARGHDVVFVTSRGRGDEEVVRKAGYELYTYQIGGLPRRPGVSQLVALFRANMAMYKSLWILRSTRADVVLGGGGFVSLPAVFAAWLRGVPAIVTEADAHLGLANRIAARYAKRLCTAYPVRQFRRMQTVTGRPIDPAFAQVDRAAARAAYGLADDARVLVVVGGSGGATNLNRATKAAWGTDRDPRVGDNELHILHVTGRRDYGELAAGGTASDRYRMIEYCTEMPQLLGAADLVVSRAGGSVFELAAVGCASVLVPFPHATADHQTRNAEHFVNAGAAVLVADADLTSSRLRELAQELLAPEADGRRAAMSQAMRRLARPGAAQEVATLVEAVGAERARRRRGRRKTAVAKPGVPA